MKSLHEKVFAIDTMLKWDREEVAFHLQPISHLLALTDEAIATAVVSDPPLPSDVISPLRLIP